MYLIYIHSDRVIPIYIYSEVAISGSFPIPSHSCVFKVTLFKLKHKKKTEQQFCSETITRHY